MRRLLPFFILLLVGCTGVAGDLDGAALSSPDVPTKDEDSGAQVTPEPVFLLQVRARHESGLPVSPLHVRVDDASGAPVEEGEGIDGLWSASLRAGEYRVRAWTQGRLLGTRDVSLNRDETLVVDADAVEVEPPPLSVSLASDAPPGRLTSALRVQLTAQASADVSQVDFLYDGELVATSSAPPFTHVWLPTAADTGIHHWSVVAFDSAGNRAVSPEDLRFEVVINTHGCPALPPVEGFVTRSKGKLMLEGQVFRASGTNLYYLQQDLSTGRQTEPARLTKVRTALDEAVCLNAHVVRTWGFNDTTNDVATIQSSPGVYREQGLLGLDQAIAEAKVRGIRLILTLVNNWPNYGGLNRYAEWAGKSHDDFFSDPRMQGWLKSYASMLASRVNTVTGIAYKDEPTLLAIEIGNELRCATCRGTSRYAATIAELARHLKATFPNHLIADGGEGMDDQPAHYPGLSSSYPVSGYEGASYSQLLAIPELDLVSYHLYPSKWALNNAADVNVWVDVHQSLALAAGKVAYLGEFGLPLADKARAPLFDKWLARAFTNNSAMMTFFWQLTPAGMTDSEGYGVYYKTDAQTVQVLQSWGSNLE